ncbi:LOW QUALITY PROTEIN: hypothetical protein N665_1116s0014 [Sinapis alba]|nr:LOW QUALITY PROTEIN: hypothetical protein N665_1116s0014 [Sinapis alba]
MQGKLWLVTFLLVFSSACLSQLVFLPNHIKSPNFIFLLPNHIKSPNFNEKIGTPHSKSPPAHGCKTWQQAHTRPSCKSKPPKGSVG